MQALGYDRGRNALEWPLLSRQGRIDRAPYERVNTFMSKPGNTGTSNATSPSRHLFRLMIRALISQKAA